MQTEYLRDLVVEIDLLSEGIDFFHGIAGIIQDH
jgi:hypothetical protein